MKSQRVVKKIREFTGLTQAAFAKVSGLHRSAISYFELGLRAPMPHHARKYLKISSDFGMKVALEDFYE